MDQFSSHPLNRKHNLDSAMSSLFGFYKDHFLALFLTSFIASLAMQFLSSTFDYQKLLGTTDPYEMLKAMKSMIMPMGVSMLINFLLMVILQYYIIYKPVDTSVNIFNALYKSLKYILPLIVISILFAVFSVAAMVIGILAIFIGVFFALLYVCMIALFITPVLMTEGTNIGKAIGRTFALSHKRFWPNMGWTAVILLIVIVASLILSSIILIPFSGSFFKILTHPEEAAEAMSFMSNPIYIILAALAGSIFTPLMPILGAILYFNAKSREIEASLPVEGNNEPDRVRVEDLYAKPYSDDHPDNPDNK